MACDKHIQIKIKTILKCFRFRYNIEYKLDGMQPCPNWSKKALSSDIEMKLTKESVCTIFYKTIKALFLYA
jgi:hypothetical protein